MQKTVHNSTVHYTVPASQRSVVDSAEQKKIFLNFRSVARMLYFGYTYCMSSDFLSNAGMNSFELQIMLPFYSF